jgi:hypothetical protein
MASDRIPQRYDPAVPVERLSEHPRNPRKGDMGRLDRSMAAHGFYGAVYAQESTGVLIAGNHRVRKAIERGEPDVPVIWLQVDDDKALELLLIDNWVPDGATYDDRLLLEAMAGLDSLYGTGYDETDREALEHLLRDDAWDGTGGPGAGGGGDDDDSLWPVIAVKVPSDVFEAWTALLAGYQGKDDAAKLAAHLTETGHLQ